MTSLNGNIFRIAGPLSGNLPVTGGLPSQRPVTWIFDVFFDGFWTNGWANKRDGGDLRCHRIHYDIIVMGRHAPTYFNQKVLCILWMQKSTATSSKINQDNISLKQQMQRSYTFNLQHISIISIPKKKIVMTFTFFNHDIQQNH